MVSKKSASQEALTGETHQPLVQLHDSEPVATYSYWYGTFILRGSVASRVALDVVGFGALAAVIVLTIQQLEARFAISLAVPVSPFETAGAVLGLLLVLRVNAGYSRWWEARVLWGGIVNQSRNLAITGLAYGPRSPAWRARFVRWVAAYPHVARRSLRGERSFPELERLLSDTSRDWIEKADHMPDAVSSEIALLLEEARSLGMDGFAFQKAEEQRAKLIDHLGGCERILKTPLARSSAIQVRQFIFLLLISLPFALTQHFDGETSISLFTDGHANQLWVVPFFVMLLAYPLLSLDRIGMELQNPFSPKRIDFLPLDAICVNIERNVLELLHEIDGQHTAAPRPSQVDLPPDAQEDEHPALDVDIS
jgi:ion channel-forming bestrophin family protein